MTVEQYLAFIFPNFSDIDAADVLSAIEMSAGYRAECLPLEKQNESQALYAAYLLELKAKRDSGSDLSVPAGPLIQEKEGQLERRYSEASGLLNGYTDHSYYGRWKALSDLCLFGAIVTRFG